MLKDLPNPLSGLSLRESAAKPMTNLERLEIIRELQKQPATEGEVWFLIPTSWIIDWKYHCEQQPEAFDTEFRCLDTSSVGYISIYPGYKLVYALDSNGWLSEYSHDMMVSHATWSALSNWWVIPYND